MMQIPDVSTVIPAQFRVIVFDLMAVSILCSLLHSALPPWDADPFKPFPTFQKYYRALIYVLGYIALNGRSTLYKSISINNPNGLNSGNGKAPTP